MQGMSFALAWGGHTQRLEVPPDCAWPSAVSASSKWTLWRDLCPYRNGEEEAKNKGRKARPVP